MGLVEVRGRLRKLFVPRRSATRGENLWGDDAAEELDGYRQRSAEVEHVVGRGSGGRSPGATGGREGQPRDASSEASAGATLGEVTPTGAEAGRRGPSAEQRSDAKHLSELGMQARYHRDRHRLYAARMGSSRPFSLSKLHELKRRREISESALRHAKDAKQGASPGPRHAAGGDRRMD